ncbi:MAG: helix-turn-helix transcriptional regulator [Clostridia bacterium]|nr:helix-turn-helix transcriptional regulator [Clostridia bacterium]
MRLVDAVYLRIIDLVKERNITIYNLSKRSGVPHPTILTMTRSSTVKLSTIYGICEGLEISLKEFFDSPRFKREIVTD